MQQPRFVPLDLDLIDEGQFVAAAAEEFAQLQNSLVAYKNIHRERSEGVKAVFTIEVTLSVDSVEDDLFGISAITKSKLPVRPASTSVALAGQTDGGEGALFVRQTGSDRATPAQTKLCTDRGETIDPETGRKHKHKDN